MGSDYTLYEDEEDEFFIVESSNKLEFVNYNKETNEVHTITSELEPKEMMRILLLGIQSCSYWMSSEEFKQTFKKHYKDYSS